MTIQQKVIAVRIGTSPTPPTISDLDGLKVPYWSNGQRGEHTLSSSAVGSSLAKLRDRGIVVQAGVGDRNAKTWKLSDEAQHQVTTWTTEIEEYKS